MLLLPVVLHRYSNECSFSFSFFQSLHAHSNGLQFFAWPCFRVYTCVWWAVANDKKKAEHLTLRTRITARLWHRVHSSSVFKLAVKSESEEPLWLTLGVCIILYIVHCLNMSVFARLFVWVIVVRLPFFRGWNKQYAADMIACGCACTFIGFVSHTTACFSVRAYLAQNPMYTILIDYISVFVDLCIYGMKWSTSSELAQV